MNKTTQIGIDGILDQSVSMNKNLPSRGIGISDECVYDQITISKHVRAENLKGYNFRNIFQQLINQVFTFEPRG